jgi:membrane protease subunit HflK
VFVLISLFVVLVRHELDLAPEIAAPAPGVEGGDLGILTYLEKNTGISMRSLWSIQMIKQALPYAALGVILLLWGVTGVSLVNSNQEGAHYRFGKLREETLAHGIHFTLPWPFDRVEVYDTGTVSQLTVGYVAEGSADNFWTEAHGGEEYRLLLGNGNELVSINLRVMYRIEDLRAYLTSSATPEFLMSAASYEIVTARTIVSDLDTMLSTDRAVFADSFREELTAYMQLYNTGLAVVDVVLESIHPPVEIADIYQALISAEIEADRILIDAEAYRGERLAWAWVDYDSQVALATINGKEALAAATGSVAEFLASVEADKAYPDDYRYYKYMKAIAEAYKDAKLVIVGDGINEGNIYIGSTSSGLKQ